MNNSIIIPPDQPLLGEYAKKLREDHNISVAQMATRANCTRQTIYNFESGNGGNCSILIAYLKLVKEGGTSDN